MLSAIGFHTQIITGKVVYDNTANQEMSYSNICDTSPDLCYYYKNVVTGIIRNAMCHMMYISGNLPDIPMFLAHN